MTWRRLVCWLRRHCRVVVGLDYAERRTEARCVYCGHRWFEGWDDR